MSESTRRLAALEPRCDADEALSFFDDLPIVPVDELTGRWYGRELATGHPWDGLLAASGWYGKQFDSSESIHPLLFRTPRGRIYRLRQSSMPGRAAFTSMRRPAPTSTTPGRSRPGAARPRRA